MSTFTVDPGSLSGLSSTLSQVHAQMQSMQGVASGYEGLLGGSDLEGEVSHFCSTWHYGISELSDHMGEVVQRLDYAASGYGRSEQSIARAAQAQEGR
jgi:hypothetical protein